jgi:hypothetical protein
MRIPAGITDADLREAHEAAGTVASEENRQYLPGRLLPLLVARFRDDTAEALGMRLPPLARRPPPWPARLEALTSGEVGILTVAVETLVTRFTPCMDDPELPRLLAAFREELTAEHADRSRTAAEDTAKACAS